MRQVMFLRQASELNVSFVATAHHYEQVKGKPLATVPFRNEIILQFLIFKTDSNYFNNFRTEPQGIDLIFIDIHKKRNLNLNYDTSVIHLYKLGTSEPSKTRV